MFSIQSHCQKHMKLNPLSVKVVLILIAYDMIRSDIGWKCGDASQSKS